MTEPKLIDDIGKGTNTISFTVTYTTGNRVSNLNPKAPYQPDDRLMSMG
jgi:hypothetical protein